MHFKNMGVEGIGNDTITNEQRAAADRSANTPMLDLSKFKYKGAVDQAAIHRYINRDRKDGSFFDE